LESLVSSVLPVLSAGRIAPIFRFFIVRHEIANLFSPPFKANFENWSCAMLGGERFSSQTVASQVQEFT
jgi:hypothetical protein